MSKLKTATSLLQHPRRFLKQCMMNGALSWLSDERYLQLLYWLSFGKNLNLKQPLTFNEKLQWLKIYDRRPIYVQMVDKVSAKELVAAIIGAEYVIPTLGVWDSPNEIDFDTLPERFVLKTTHDSGGIRIIDKSKGFDRDEIRAFLWKHFKNDLFRSQREWPYKTVKPRVLAEVYMEDSKTGELRDYKVFVFGGEAKTVHIATGRQSADRPTAFDFFDRDFRHMDFEKGGYPNADPLPEKPQHLELMFKLAERLAGELPFLRVDFFEADGRVYFGEFTFYPGSGFSGFKPEKWDAVFGSWLTLPLMNSEDVAISVQ